MIWRREEKISHGGLGPLSVPPNPASKEFELLLNLLIDAEAYDSRGHIDSRNEILIFLKNQIDRTTSTKNT